MEVLRVHMERVGREPAERLRRVFVRAEEIAHIQKKPVIRVLHAGHEPFHAQALLTEEPVVLAHGADALARGILRHGAAAADQLRQHVGKAHMRPLRLVRQAPRDVMPHHPATQGRGNVDLAAETIDLPVGLGSRTREIRADRITDDGDPDTLALFTQRLRVFFFVRPLGRVDLGEFDAVEAHGLRKRY